MSLCSKKIETAQRWNFQVGQRKRNLADTYMPYNLNEQSC